VGDVVKDGEGAIVAPVGQEKKIAEAIGRYRDDENLRAALRAGTKKVIDRLQAKEEYLAEYKKSWMESFRNRTA